MHRLASYSSAQSKTREARTEMRSRPRLRNIWIAVGSVVVTLVVLELAVRVYAYHLGRGFTESPMEFVSPFFTSGHWPAPYRDQDTLVFKEGERVPIVKPPGEIRIVCLGGSTTLPANDSEQVSYARELERSLAQEFPGTTIHVLNAGENSFSTAHMVVDLALRVLEAQPDVITVYENINDLSVNYFGTQPTSDYSNKYLTPIFLGYRHRVGVLAEAARISRLARMVENRMDTFLFALKDYDPTRDYRPGLPYFERNLRSIVAIAQAHGVDVVLGTQAARTSRRTSDGFSAYNAAVRRIANDVGVKLAEVADTVTDDHEFVDDVHNTSPGARHVAAQWLHPVADLVRQRLEAARLSLHAGSDSNGRARTSSAGIAEESAVRLVYPSTCGAPQDAERPNAN